MSAQRVDWAHRYVPAEEHREMPGDLATPGCSSGRGGRAGWSAGRGTRGWRACAMFASVRRGRKRSADAEPGGTETSLMRRLGTWSLGVGVENGSDWKGKLQEGSGGARWGLAGQGNQSEVWDEVWKMGWDRRRGGTNSTPNPAWNRDAWKQSCLCFQHVTWGNPPAEVSLLSRPVLVLILPKPTV